MNWLKTRVRFEAADPETAADLISDIFYDLGITGVVVDDPDLEPAEGWGDGAACRPEFHAVTGYFPFEGSERNRMRLATGLRELEQRVDIRCWVEYQQADEEDWAESWKTWFHPVRLSGRLVVKPTWRSYEASPQDLIIEIDPGMAFGTGTHPTTVLCARTIERCDPFGKTLLDVGTGSGILMIAAFRLGAKRVYGVDLDITACRIARQNLLLNGIPDTRFLVAAGKLIDCIKNQPDIVVANILTDVILELLGSLSGIMSPGGIFICSGIVEPNAPLVTKRLREAGFQVLKEEILEGWSCITSRWIS